MKSILSVIIFIALIGGCFYYLVSQDKIKNLTPTINPTTTPKPDQQIFINEIKDGQKIQSPLVITGSAKGTWYFEASFPIKLIDQNGKLIATAIAQAQSDWMTTNFVPFKATLTFKKPTTSTGKLIFQKDNPSGLPQNSAQKEIDITF